MLQCLMTSVQNPLVQIIPKPFNCFYIDMFDRHLRNGQIPNHTTN